MTAMSKGYLLEALHVTKDYRVQEGFFDTKGHVVRALDRVDLSIGQGEVLGLVGESGCGKSTLARVLLGLERPSSGKVFYRGVDPAAMDRQALMAFRRDVQMVFQDPSSSLNPKKTVFQTLSEPLKIHRLCPGRRYRDEVARLLEEVGLDADAMDRYPHQFSGGQRQRIGLARALSTRPKMIVADEPTSALDVSIQAQIINLLLELKKRLGLAYLFISHDLPVVQYVSQRVAVMYRGQVMELLESTSLLEEDDVRHPYTEYLVSSVPVPDPARRSKKRERRKETGDPDGYIRGGCTFYHRCVKRDETCAHARPGPVKISDSHVIWCHKIAPAD